MELERQMASSMQGSFVACVGDMDYGEVPVGSMMAFVTNNEHHHPQQQQQMNSEALYQSTLFQSYYPAQLVSHPLVMPTEGGHIETIPTAITTSTSLKAQALSGNKLGSSSLLPYQALDGGFSRLSESDSIRDQIMSHPRYPQLLTAYMNCQKVGAPPELVSGLDELSKEYQNHLSKRSSIGFGSDPELDRFMEEYCSLLQRLHEELTRPFKEAMSFFRKIELQLNTLSKGTLKFSSSAGEGQDKETANASSEEEDGSCGEIEFHDVDPLAEEAKLKEQLLRKYSGYICTLKQEFLKKKKKGKLPKEARQKLLDWWNQHYKWPYPSETEKTGLAESTGLDQKQINNWFINQRKRHWKPSEDLHYAMESSSVSSHHPHYHHTHLNPYHYHQQVSINPFNESTSLKTEMGLIPMDHHQF